MIEIAERDIMDSSIHAVVSRLTDMGVSISVDNFGTGYSSLVQLRRLPIAEIKIDPSFVTELASSPESRAIAHSIVELAHNVGVPVVADGIETRETWPLIVELGCDYAQGPLISDADHRRRARGLDAHAGVEHVASAEPGRALARTLTTNSRTCSIVRASEGDASRWRRPRGRQEAAEARLGTLRTGAGRPPRARRVHRLGRPRDPPRRPDARPGRPRVQRQPGRLPRVRSPSSCRSS